MSKHLILMVVLILLASASCKRPKQSKSDLDIAFTQDTLNVGYTYWWQESGPFVGECGDELSLVFSGTITEILEPTDEAGPLYSSQKGIIEIDRVFKIKDLGPNSYDNQQFFVSDCFDGLGLKKADKVLVFCYDYENALSISGGHSIIQLDSFDDPLIASIKKYLDADQDPSKIKKDIALWEKYGLGTALEQIISCH